MYPKLYVINTKIFAVIYVFIVWWRWNIYHLCALAVCVCVGVLWLQPEVWPSKFLLIGIYVYYIDSEAENSECFLFEYTCSVWSTIRIQIYYLLEFVLHLKITNEIHFYCTTKFMKRIWWHQRSGKTAPPSSSFILLSLSYTTFPSISSISLPIHFPED